MATERIDEIRELILFGRRFRDWPDLRLALRFHRAANPYRTTLLIALWGAVTGTIAVGIQAIQHYLDRARLVVKPSISQYIDRATPVARICVDVSNRGRRPLSIEHIGIILPNDKKRDPNVRQIRKQTPLFDAITAGKVLRLAEGDKHTFRHDFFPQAWGRSLYEKGKTGKYLYGLPTEKSTQPSTI
jgi:hypothetical protein